jgi:esterase/lipase superfamily enzyme
MVVGVAHRMGSWLLPEMVMAMGRVESPLQKKTAVTLAAARPIRIIAYLD